MQFSLPEHKKACRNWRCSGSSFSFFVAKKKCPTGKSGRKHSMNRRVQDIHFPPLKQEPRVFADCLAAWAVEQYIVTGNHHFLSLLHEQRQSEPTEFEPASQGEPQEVL